MDVNSQQRPQDRCQVLGIASRVPAGTAVADADVQVAVRAEGESATVVVGKGLVDREQHLLGGRIGKVWITGDFET